MIRSEIGPLTSSDGVQVTDSQHVAKLLLNNPFSSEFDTSILPTTNTSDDNSSNINLEYSLPNFVITTNEVLKSLQSLEINKNPGPDKVYLIQGAKYPSPSQLYSICLCDKASSLRIRKT